MLAYFSVPSRQKSFFFGAEFLRGRNAVRFFASLALAQSSGLFRTDPQEIRQELQHA